MDSEEDLSFNPWARFLGIDRIEYLENVEASFKPKTNVTRLNYEDMGLFGLCPMWEDLHLIFCKICESILKPQAFKAHMELKHPNGEENSLISLETSDANAKQNKKRLNKFTRHDESTSSKELKLASGEGHTSDAKDSNLKPGKKILNNIARFNQSMSKRKLPSTSGLGHGMDAGFASSECPTATGELFSELLWEPPHKELRHGINGTVTKQNRKLSTEYSTSKRRIIAPSAMSSIASVACSITSPTCSITSATCSNASAPISSAFPICSDISIASSSSTTINLNPPPFEAKPTWLFSRSSMDGAIQQQQSSNVSANIVRVKPENSKPKMALSTSYTEIDSSLNSLSKNIMPKKITSLKKELPSSQELMLPELSSSVVPSATNRILPPAESKSDGNIIEHSPILQSNQPSSTSLPESSPNNSETSEGKKAPALEKLVLRRVLQTGPHTSAVRRPTVQKGMKGIARNKNDSSEETYFMVVKDKDRQHNLLAARIRKQSNVVHQEKDKVEQKMKKLKSVRDKLISQLFQELQAVKQKLHQCNVSKSELHKELLAVRGQLEEARRTTELQTEALSKQNSEYKKEIQDLKEKIDLLTASTSSFMEQQQMANQACNLPEDDLKTMHLQYCEEQKFLFQKRLEELESELRSFKNSSNEEKKHLDFKVRQYATIITQLKRRLDLQVTQNEELRTQKDMLEKHLPPEIRFQVKSQLANFQMQQEIYPGLNLAESSIPSPAVPFAEKFMTDLRNIEYCAFQHQMAND